MNAKMIDLRSDTVTRPCPNMRMAMANAEVGDDVFEDDPTVKELEFLAAEILGKEAALFVTSGTLGNNIAIKVHTKPGDEVLMDWDSHSMCYEVGAPAVISAVQMRQFRSTLGVPPFDEIAGAISGESLHSPKTSLIILENTHNRHGGAIIPQEVIDKIGLLAKEKGVALHMDGARLFNAAVASGIPAKEIVKNTDSVTFCLSKGLGCPVGSVMVGTKEFIEKARRVRKMLGGGMRQVGILAAGGVYALKNNIDRLAIDHANAHSLAVGLSSINGIHVDMATVQTNMVYLQTDSNLIVAPVLEKRLLQNGVSCLAVGPNTIRMVCHLDVSAEDISQTIAMVSKCV